MTAMTRKQFVALCAAAAIAPPTARAQSSQKAYVPTELWQLDAWQLAQRIQSKQVSSREVIRSCLDRIASCNSRYNAIGEVIAERALKMADAADGTKDRGPLHGVPITIKSNIDLAGSATSEGLTIWKNRVESARTPQWFVIC